MKICLIILQVDERCGTGQIRHVSRHCVDSDYNCEVECNGGTGSILVGVGTCQCDNVVDPRSICVSDECRNCQPNVNVKNDGGSVFVEVTDCNSNVLMQQQTTGYFGLNSHSNQNFKCQVVELDAEGKSNGKFFQSNDAAVQEFFPGQLPAQFSNRKRRQEPEVSEPLSVSNPLICLEAGEAVIFQIAKDENSSGYHYPVYIKDNLLNTNPLFDFGMFRILANLLSSSVNITNFVSVFSEPGTYVFQDSIAMDSSQTIIVVAAQGGSCEQNGDDFRVLPVTETSLSQFGVRKETNLNESPDFLAYTVFIVLALVITVGMVIVAVISRPKSVGIDLAALKPRYRRVDDPKVIYITKDSDDFDTLEKRGIGVGAASPLTVVSASQRSFELENFNVRTFYDKLEDQNLYVSTQLARQQIELRSFYDQICQQTEGLKSLLSETEVLATIDRNRKYRESMISQDREEPVGSEASYVPPKQVTPTSNAELELMTVLKDLLIKAASQPGRGAAVVSPKVDSEELPAKLSRRWTIERHDLERDLTNDELKNINEVIKAQVCVSSV